MLSLAALQEVGAREEAREPGRFEANLRGAKPTDLATICYTSGTTGIPKGAALDHGCFASVMDDAMKLIGGVIEPEKEVTVAFLPYSHILGKCQSVMGYSFGWKECYAESLDKLVEDIRECRPTVLVAVPRIFEKAYARIQATLEEGPPARRKVFEHALAAGRRYYEAIWNKRRPATRDALEYAVASRVVFRSKGRAPSR